VRPGTADLYDTLIRLYIEPRLGRKKVREIDKGLILARARAQVNRCHRISGAVSLRCLLLCRNGRRAGRPYLVDTSPMMIGTGSSISSLVGSFGKRKSSASHLFRRVFEPLLIMNSASVSDLNAAFRIVVGRRPRLVTSIPITAGSSTERVVWKPTLP
jgi:hypothetical protein